MAAPAPAGRHSFGPRPGPCRVSLVVAGSGQHTTMSELLALTLADFASQVTLLAEPSESQLASAVADLTASAAAEPWAEEASLHFAGTCCMQDDSGSGGGDDGAAPGSRRLLLLVVAADEAAGNDPAGGSGGDAAMQEAGGSSNCSGGSRVLVAPLEALEAAAEAARLPLLLHIDAVTQGPQGGASAAAAAAGIAGLRSADAKPPAFSQRVTALAHQGGGAEAAAVNEDGATAEAASEYVVAWSWLLYKHTFVTRHASWGDAHAAAAGETRQLAGASQLALDFGAGSGSQAGLFPHGCVPEQHHRVLSLLSNISTAAAALPAPPARRTAALLHQLHLLLRDAGWRPFVLRWGLLLLHAPLSEGAEGVLSSPLDDKMRQLAGLFAPHVALPGALLALAATSSGGDSVSDAAGNRVAAAAARVLARLPGPLSGYGCLPGEVPGQPDMQARAELAARLLEVAVPLSTRRRAVQAAPGGSDGAQAGGSGEGSGGPSEAAAVPTAGSQPLWLLPFVSGFVEAAGLGQELQQRREAAGPGAAWQQEEDEEAAEPAGLAAAAAAKRVRPQADGMEVDGDSSGGGGAEEPASGEDEAALLQSVSDATISQLLELLHQHAPPGTAAAPQQAPPRASVLPPPSGTLGGLPSLFGGAFGGGGGGGHTSKSRRRKNGGGYGGAGGLFSSLAASLSPPTPPAPLMMPQQLQQGISGGGGSSSRHRGRQLPESATELSVFDVTSAGPLLLLPQLRRLVITACTTSAYELARLSSLTSLSEVDLRHGDPNAAAAAAPAWPRLPLRKLSLGATSKKKYRVMNTSAVLSSLGQCTTLTSLKFPTKLPVAPARLAPALERLVQLEELSLAFLSTENNFAAGWSQVLRAIAGLPSLASLNLSYTGAGVGEAAGELAATASSRLTLLNLQCVGLRDDAAIRLVSAPALVSLVSLDVSRNTGLTDAAAAAMTGLTALTQLALSGCAVTPAGRAAVNAALPQARIV